MNAESGLPAIIRWDTGVPFASTGLGGLTRLSAYWMRLGIRLERIRRTLNHERPHEALEMKRPADVYIRSTRALPSRMPEPTYPLHDDVLDVTRHGSIHLPRRGQVYPAAALAGHPVGIREEDDGQWSVAFMALELGYIDPQTKTFEPTASTPRQAT